MIQIAVVGGGPAGSYCAHCLAVNSLYPVIFDHTHPREKPCGGLVTPFAQRLFPLLKKLPIKHGERSKIHLISPSGVRDMTTAVSPYSSELSIIRIHALVLSIAARASIINQMVKYPFLRSHSA